MKRVLTSFFLSGFALSLIYAQVNPSIVDSLKMELHKAEVDTARILILEELVTNTFNLTRFDESKEYLNELGTLVKKTNWPRGVIGHSYRKMRMKFAFTYEWDSALYYGYKGTLVLSQHPDKFPPEWYNRYPSTIGLIYKNMEEFDSAFHYYDIALKQFESKGSKNTQDLVIIYKNIANLHRKLGNDQASLDYSYRVLDLAKESGDEIMILDAYSRLAKAHSDLRLNDKTIQTIDLVVDGYLEKDSIAFAGKIHALYRLKGLNLSRQDNFDESIKYLRKSYSFEEEKYGENHWKLWDISIALAEVYIRQEKYDSAKYYLKNILKMPYVSSSNRDVSALCFLGEIESKLGNYETATNYFVASLRHTTKDPDKQSFVWRSIAESYLVRDQLDSAILSFEKSLLTNTRISHKNLYAFRKIAHIYLDKFKKNNSIDDLAQSVKIYTKCDSLLTEFRNSYALQKDDIDFNQLYVDVYKGGVEASLNLYLLTKDSPYLESAFYFSEKSKSSALLKSLQIEEKLKLANIPDNLIDKKNELKSVISFYTDNLINRETFTKEKISKYETALVKSQSEYENLMLHLKNDFPSYFDFLYRDEFFNLQEVQNQLAENETLLEYSFTNKESICAFVISREEVEVVTIPVPEDFPSLIQSHQEAMKSFDRKDHLAINNRLYELLIQPIDPHLTNKELIIIPDQQLWYVNFELLTRSKDAPDYLLFDYAISYANSFKYLNNQKKEKSTVNGCLAFSYSRNNESEGSIVDFKVLRDSDNPLPGASREISEISNLIPGTYFYGDEANEKNFREMSQDYSILHLALHAEINESNSDNSYLKFYSEKQDSTEDNLLYVYELYNMKLNADLAVLSACNTGSGQLQNGEGVMSLGRAFQYAGVESLLISNWVLVDDVAPIIIKKFYSNLKKGMSKSEALQKAKIMYLETSSESLAHPYFWAALTLVGDKSPLYKKDNDFLYLILSSITGALLLFFIVYRARLKKQLI